MTVWAPAFAGDSPIYRAQNGEKPRDSLAGVRSFSRRRKPLPFNSLDALRDGTSFPERLGSQLYTDGGCRSQTRFRSPDRYYFGDRLFR